MNYFQFHDGQRVRLSRRGLEACIGRNYNETTLATVVRAPVVPEAYASLKVLKDGRKTASSYIALFWEPVK